MTAAEGVDPPDDHAAHAVRRDATPFRRMARRFTAAMGSALGATLVVVAAAAWLGVGIANGFPRWWELVASCGVPFLTLLMVVLVQHTQNHDDRATQLKLDELIRATGGATNRMMTVEDARAEDLDRIHDEFQTQAESPSPQDGESGI